MNTLILIASLTCGLKPIVPMGCDDLICINGQWSCVNYRYTIVDKLAYNPTRSNPRLTDDHKEDTINSTMTR